MPAIIVRVGVNDYAGGAMLLRHKCLHSAKVLPVTNQYDLAANIYFHLLEFAKIFRCAIIRIYRICFHVSGGRHGVVRRQHARIILERIVIGMFASGTMHGDTCWRSHIHADLAGIVEPNFVFDNFCFQARLAEFLRNVISGGFVLRRTRRVRRLGKYAQMFFRQFRARDGEKTLLDRRLICWIAETKNRGLRFGGRNMNWSSQGAAQNKNQK